jgi:hypothetical protein
VALIVVLGVALIVVGSTVVPIRNVNYNQSNITPTAPGINNVYVSLDADVADINVFTVSAPDELARVNVSVVGSTGLFGSNSQPVKVQFNSTDSNGTSTVTCKITRDEAWPLSYALGVTCNIYLNPNVTLNVQVSTGVGNVKLVSNQSITYQALSLQSTTGTVDAAISGNAAFNGPIKASTVTGSVEFRWSNCQLRGNNSLTLAATTGSVYANLTQDQPLGGIVTVSAATVTGSVNFNLLLSGSNAACITSNTSVGHISATVQNFNGNQSPLYSINYPATNNLRAYLATTVGSVNIEAAYQGPSGNPF